MPTTIAIVAHGTLPASDKPATGIGIRAWALKTALEAEGFDVRLCLAEGGSNPEDDAVFFNYTPGKNINAILKKIAPDIVIVEWWKSAEFIATGDYALVLDCPAPMVLEHYYLGEDFQKLALRKATVFSKADAVICSNDRQRYYFLPWLLLSGRLETPIITVPNFSVYEPVTEHVKSAERTLIYAGVFWPWQRADWALGVAVDEMEKAGKGKLIVVGGANPFKGEFAGREYAPLLPSSSRIERKEMLPYGKLMELYSSCHASMQVFEPNIERELSSSFRMVDALSAGLPIFVTEGIPYSERVANAGAGWSIPFNNENILRSAVKRFLDEDLTRLAVAAHALADSEFSPHTCIHSLVDFCNNPKKQARPTNWIKKLSPLDFMKASPLFQSLLRRLG